MKLESAELLVDYLPDAEVYEEYSGRGMYGKTTTGIVVPSVLGVISELGQVLEDMAEHGETDDITALSKAMQDVHSIDNMGRDNVIIY